MNILFLCSNDLVARTFKTLDFYRQHQNDITPAGLAFFQSDWDASVKDVFHQLFDIKEPIFEYDFPQPYRRDERYFPLRQAFNLYLDRYRDQKQINKEFLVRKLNKTHPFDGPEPPLRFPNAHPLKDIPSWLINEKKKARLGWGQINQIQ